MGVIISAYTADKSPLSMLKFATPFSEQDGSVGVEAMNYMHENLEAFLECQGSKKRCGHPRKDVGANK
jgi:hypothetical protein